MLTEGFRKQLPSLECVQARFRVRSLRRSARELLTLKANLHHGPVHLGFFLGFLSLLRFSKEICYTKKVKSPVG